MNAGPPSQPLATDACTQIGEATRAAAERLQRLEPRLRGQGSGGYISERDLQDALGAYLAHAVVERKCPCPIPHWDPQPGNIDVWVPNSRGLPELVIETKLKDSNKVYECLWDLVKVAALRTLDHVRCGLLVVGFLRTYLDRPVACVDLLQPGRHGLADAIRGRYRELWTQKVLPGGNGRPLRGPEAIDVGKITSVELMIWGYPVELQALKIEPVGNWTPLPVEAAT